MSEEKTKLQVVELKARGEAELQSLIATKLEELRKFRFKHAMGQLRETHVLRNLRRDIAKVRTALRQRAGRIEVEA